MPKRSCLAIILAAGEGTRMKSATPKVLHKVAGLPMLGHVLKAAEAGGAGEIAVVVGPGMEAVDRLPRQGGAGRRRPSCRRERLGTGHAVLAAKKAINRGADDVLVLFGDTPLVTGRTLKRLRAALARGADIAVLGFRPPDPTGYGRLITQGRQLVAIREEKDASPEEKLIGLCNAGVMAFRGARA